ncbi:MAG: hypothetical protein STSR0009_17040 [Methanoregula sp.]
MDDFVNFIIQYIENTEIHGRKGWIDQLSEYRWKTKTGIERFSEGVQTSKNFKLKTHDALKTPGNGEIWCRHCKEIVTWGGMREVSPDLAIQYKKSVNYLLENDPGINSDFETLPISGKRIATASKIYYYSDPLRWTIYDSRVGYAIHQLIFEYARDLKVSPELLFSEIPICLPDSQTDRRNPIYPVPRCYYSETKSKGSFIWASHLHRLIASKLNETLIPKPAQYFSAVPQWELPHIEMIFFVIGDRKWIDAPDI